DFLQPEVTCISLPEGRQLAVVAVVAILQPREAGIRVFGQRKIYAVLQGVLAGNPAVAGIGSQSEYVAFRALEKWHIARAVCNGLVPAFPSIPIVVYPLAHGLPH